MLSVVFHFALSLLNIIGAIAAYFILKKEDSRKNIMEHLFLFFVFFTGYHLSLALPFWFYPGNLTAMAWGYNIAIAFLFLLLAPMYSIMVFQILGVPVKRLSFYIKIFLLFGLLPVLLQVCDFHLPTIDDSGFIIWNNNLIAGAISALAGASIAVIWTIIFFKNKPADLSFADKLRATVYTIGGLMFSLASIYFIARNVTMVILAFIFVFVGTILMNVIVLIPEKKKIN